MLIKPDPATPEGEAVIDLAEMMDELQEDTGEWPGADTVDILGGWLGRFTFAVSESFASQVTGRAWVLRQWDRDSDEVTLWSDEASALAALAQHVRSSWDNVVGSDGVPYCPPADDRTAVDLYYGPKVYRGDEGYTLYAADISRCVRTPRSLSLSDAEDCAEANSTAVFHPMEGPDDEGLPCIEIAGILVFAYLDADRGAVRVSVHLDTTDEQLIRADSTVPMQVEIETATVFDNLTPPPAPAEPTGWKARIWRLARRTALSHGRERRQGG
ncbi:hypothetical protein FE633_13575 [Streptomyces montanus]|uniref:Uncharacterized protein n=1 Tax=Streptomyces montanus TaxID=2580423 RepID=A0A5R9FY91_9ACTN|nr:hypothetical protein [Streptomyces montanus]TLS45783.1 hypothetical protein FE633_13575 [Streptomyces montanus]